MGRVSYFRLGMLLFFSAAVTVACSERTPLEGGRTGQDWRTSYAAWTHPEPIPDFQLLDQEGRMFRLSQLPSGYLLVGFIFSRCAVPSACPLTMKKMRQVQHLWSTRQAPTQETGKALHLLSLTLDPEFDRPDVLKAYGVSHDVDFASWTLATGETELLSDALPSLFNIIALPDDKVTLAHTVKVALLGPGRRLLKSWSDNGFSSEEVIDAIVHH